MNTKNIHLKKKYDVVIIGSGPAGAAAAKGLSGQGLNVAIIEKHRLPRYKMCNGILFYDAIDFIQQYFGELPEKVYSDPLHVKGTRTYPNSDTPFIEVAYSRKNLEVGGNNFDRAQLDYWLCTCSEADIIDKCRFRGCAIEGNEMIVFLERDNKPVEVSSTYLVGADGTLSSVRKSIFPDYNRKLGLISNYEEWYAGELALEPGWLYAFHDRRFTGFFAAAFCKDNRIQVVTGGKRKEPIKQYFTELVSHLKSRHGLKIKTRISSGGCVIHDMAATNNFLLGKGNILFAGEAGGFNRAAEGFSSALVTGHASADAILKSLDTGQPLLPYYKESVAEEMKKCIKANRHLEKMLGLNPFTR